MSANPLRGKTWIKFLLLGGLSIGMIGVSAQLLEKRYLPIVVRSGPTYTQTATPTSTSTSTPTQTNTPTQTPTQTPTNTSTPTVKTQR